MTRQISIIISVLLVALLSCCCPPRPIKEFTSDGCSLFPDGTPDNSEKWYHCCYNHDIVYWHGGPEAERKESDRGLRDCVAKTGHPLIGKVMYMGVRLFGTPYSPAWFRWGFGWPYGHGYKELTEEKQEQVDKFKPPPMVPPQ